MLNKLHPNDIYIKAAVICFTLCLWTSFHGRAATAADSFSGSVIRAMFTTAMNQTEPANEALIVENKIRNIYFFSEVEGMKGKTVIHRWESRGEVVLEKKFQVTRQSEKLVSSFKLYPDRTGEWMVIVTDETGWPFKAVMFKYVKAGSFAGKGIVPRKP